MMKKITVILISSIIASTLQAQQRPHYTQYIINPYIINPAIGGIENYTDIKLSIRDQWVGLSGAPKTTYFTIHKPLGKKSDAESPTSLYPFGETPIGAGSWKDYKASASHHGVGLSIINDKTGSFNFFSASASYAYHIGLSETLNLSGGFSAGITKVGIDRTKQDFSGTGDPFDPAVGSSSAQELSKIRPSLGVGLWLYARNYFAGFAAQQVLPQTINFVNNNTAASQKGKLVPHLFFTVGFRFLLWDEVTVVPSGMVKYINGNSDKLFQPEGNMKIQYRNLLWIGGTYRFEDGFAGMLGFNISNAVTLSYSYDRSFSRPFFGSFDRGTHEMVLGFSIGNKHKEYCPRVW